MLTEYAPGFINDRSNNQVALTAQIIYGFAPDQRANASSNDPNPHRTGFLPPDQNIFGAGSLLPFRAAVVLQSDALITPATPDGTFYAYEDAIRESSLRPIAVVANLPAKLTQGDDTLDINYLGVSTPELNPISGLVLQGVITRRQKRSRLFALPVTHSDDFSPSAVGVRGFGAPLFGSDPGGFSEDLPMWVGEEGHTFSIVARGDGVVREMQFRLWGDEFSMPQYTWGLLRQLPGFSVTGMVDDASKGATVTLRFDGNPATAPSLYSTFAMQLSCTETDPRASDAGFLHTVMMSFAVNWPVPSPSNSQ
jgi:hypothetical protein